MRRTKVENEIRHGKKLAAQSAEKVWGWSSPAGQRRAQRRAKLIVETASLTTEMDVFEIGCGNGNFTQLFARSGANILAVDISPDLLEIARKRKLPPNVALLEERFENCAIVKQFDVVIGSSILHHLEIETAMKKIFEILKPGGIIVFAEPNMMNPQIALQKNIPWLKKIMGDSPDETAFFKWSFAKILLNIGFVNVSIIPFDFLHPAIPKFMIPFCEKIGGIFEKIPLLKEIAGSLIISAAKPK